MCPLTVERTGDSGRAKTQAKEARGRAAGRNDVAEGDVFDAVAVVAALKLPSVEDVGVLFPTGSHGAMPVALLSMT